MSEEDKALPKESISAPENLSGQPEIPENSDEVGQKPENEPEKQPEQPQQNTKKLSVVEPPAGFGDSPTHQKNSEKAPEYHEALPDQLLPENEQLLLASEEISTPALQITEAFQSEIMVSEDAKKQDSESNKAEPREQNIEAMVTASNVQTLEQPQNNQRSSRKLSSTSTVSASISRPSTSASKTTQQSSRSRSCSKERLLSTLQGSENAPQTSNEEDEIEGMLKICKRAK